MQKLGFSHCGADQTAIALFNNDISKEEAIEILQAWINELECSDDDVWPQ